MNNDFLKVLNDEKERVFPLIYKHVTIKLQEQDIKDTDSNSVFISKNLDTKKYCLNFHKPISKLL